MTHTFHPGPGQPVAVIDVGSNSIKLLVARRGAPPNVIETVHSETIETRIGGGIGQERPHLSDAAITAGTATVRQLVDSARKHQPASISIVATSAVRDAENGASFVEQVRRSTGVPMRILTGLEEAHYIGKGLACDPQIAGIQRFIQMDLGGGSLELVRFGNGSIERAVSLQLGAVRLTEQCVNDGNAPINASVEASIRTHVDAALKAADFPFDPPEDPLIATGGAFVIARTMLAARAAVAVDTRPPEITLDEITALKEKLAALPLQERKEVPHLPAGRADIIPTALITIEAVLRRAGRASVTHSFYNLRYGIAAERLAG